MRAHMDSWEDSFVFDCLLFVFFCKYYIDN
jgi:hypothetical protein